MVGDGAVAVAGADAAAAARASSRTGKKIGRGIAVRRFRRPAYWGKEKRAKQRRQAGNQARTRKSEKERVRGCCGVGMRVAGAQELMQLTVAVAGAGRV